MGIFDVFSKEGRKTRSLDRKLRIIANKRAADEDRYAAYEALAEDGSPEAIYGLLIRFTYVKDIGQRSRSTDEEDKRYVHDIMVGFGDKALDEVARFLTAREGPVGNTKHSISWALRIMDEIVPTRDQEWEIILKVFEDNEPGYERDPSRKLELLTFITSAQHLDSKKVTETVLPYLADADETVRFTASEALLKHGHPSCIEGLSKLLADRDESLQQRSLIVTGFIANAWFEEAAKYLNEMPTPALKAAVHALENSQSEQAPSQEHDNDLDDVADMVPTSPEPKGQKSTGADSQAESESVSETAAAKDGLDAADESQEAAADAVLLEHVRDMLLAAAESTYADDEIRSLVAEFLVRSGVTTAGIRNRVERFLPKGYKIRKHQVTRQPDSMREPYLSLCAQALMERPLDQEATESLVKIFRSNHTDDATKGKLVDFWAIRNIPLKGYEKMLTRHLPPGYGLDGRSVIKTDYGKMAEPYLTRAADRLVDPYLSEPPDDPEEARTCIPEEIRTALLEIASNPKTDARTVDRVLDRFATYGWSILGFERTLLRTLPKDFKLHAPKGGTEPHLSKVSVRI